MKKMPVRVKGAMVRPTTRREYAKPLREIVSVLTGEFLLDSEWNQRTAKYLLKLADYLESPEYLDKSEKAVRRKEEHKARTNKDQANAQNP